MIDERGKGMNFSTLQEAKKYVREMSVADTEEIATDQVIEYIDEGDIEIVREGEDPTSDALFIVLGSVTQVLCR